MFHEKSAYGITDSLCDFFVPMAILFAIAATATVIFYIPNHWYVAIIVAPLAAWMGPFAILLPIFCIEWVIYGLLHPKESYKNILGFLSFFAVLAGSMAIALWIVRLFASIFATPDSSTWEFAYVSESPNAHRYHYSEQCNALRRTTYDIETLSVDEAEDYDYEPCSLCLKESVREKWDDAAGLVFIPVSCLLFGLINKIEQFSKKYKLRNPIVKR